MTENNRLSVWKHKKTGNIYTVIYDEAIECTNGREDIDYTVYTNGDKIFVRQTNEFYQKFEKIEKTCANCREWSYNSLGERECLNTSCEDYSEWIYRVDPQPKE